MSAQICPRCNENQIGEYEGFFKHEGTEKTLTLSICDKCSHEDRGQVTVLVAEIPAGLYVRAKLTPAPARIQAFIDTYARLRVQHHMIDGVVVPVGVSCKDYLQGKHADPVSDTDRERLTVNFLETFGRKPGALEMRHFEQGIRVRIFREVSQAA